MPVTNQAPSYKVPRPLKAKFGERVSKLRMERGLTQMQLADADYAGLDRAYISDLERGVKEPGLTTVHLIANAFGLSMSELLDGLD